MDIRALENHLDSTLESFKMQSHNQLEAFKTATDAEQAQSLPETLDHMNEQHYRALEDFKRGIMEYLRANDGRRL